MPKKKGRRSKKGKPKRNSSIASMAKKAVNKLSAPVVFWQQLSSKDYEVLNQSEAYRSLDYLEKGKVAVNILIGALTGQRPFANHYTPTPSGQPRINPTGFLNKWLGIAVLGKAYSKVGKGFGLPQTGYVNSVSNKVAWGAIAGGIFDPPSQSALRQSSTSQITPITTRNIAVRQNSAMGSYDPSTMGAFR